MSPEVSAPLACSAMGKRVQQTTFLPALVSLGLLLATALSALYVAVTSTDFQWRAEELITVDDTWHPVSGGADLLVWTHDAERTPACRLRNAEGTALLLEDPDGKYWRRDQRGGMVGTWTVRNTPAAVAIRCKGKDASPVAVTAQPVLPPALAKYGDLIWLPVALAGFSMISLAWLSGRIRRNR